MYVIRAIVANGLERGWKGVSESHPKIYGVDPHSCESIRRPDNFNRGGRFEIMFGGSQTVDTCYEDGGFDTGCLRLKRVPVALTTERDMVE